MARTLTVVFAGDAAQLERASSDASRAVDRVDQSSRNLGESFGTTASQSAQAAGGLGDLGGALAQMGGPLGKVGQGMELLAPSIMGVTGAADLAELAHGKLNLAQIKATASSVAQRAASIAGAAATGIMTGAQWLLNAALSANPIALVVIALVALVAAVIIAWQNSETFRQIVTGAFNAVLDAAQAVWHWIADNWPLLLAIITGPIGLAVLAIVKNWDSITAGFEAVVNGIKAGVDKVTEFIGKIAGKIREVIGDVTSAGKELAAGFLKGLGELVGGIGSDIASALGAAINTVIVKPINVAIGFINDKLIAGANKVPFVDIPKIPKIPELAAGGIATRATLALIGEGREPEAVLPLSALDSMLASRSSMPSTLVIVDADGALIGRMRVEAGGVLDDAGRAIARGPRR